MRPTRYCTLLTYFILLRSHSGSSVSSEDPCDSLTRVLITHFSDLKNGSLLDADTGTIYPEGSHWTPDSGGESSKKRFGCPCMLQRPCLRDRVCCEKKEVIFPIIVIYEFYVINFGYASLVSVLFIFFIAVLYSIGTKLSNLHEKSVLCYLCSYLGLFYSIAEMHFFYGKLSPPSCLAMVSLYIFTVIATFTWATVISVKITLRFRSLRPSHNTLIRQGMPKTKKFLLYCLCAWGIPLVFVLALVITENTPGLQDSFKKPIITGKACFFQETAPLVIFIVAPVYFLIMLNILLFAYTAFKIFWSRRGSTALKNDQKYKRRFNIFVKLMLVMGVPSLLHFIWFTYVPPELAFAIMYIILITEWSLFASLLFNKKIKGNLANIFLPASNCKKSANLPSPLNASEQTSSQ